MGRRERGGPVLGPPQPDCGGGQGKHFTERHSAGKPVTPIGFSNAASRSNTMGGSSDVEGPSLGIRIILKFMFSKNRCSRVTTIICPNWDWFK